MTDRRTAFRELISRLNPAEKPALALERGFYVEPAGSISARLTTALELAPTESHMLVGGIGSGKTTQLLRLQQRLGELDDVRAFYLDVLEKHRVERSARPGVLLALAGIELAAAAEATLQVLPDEVRHARRTMKDLADGRLLDYPELFEPEEPDNWKPGLVDPPTTDHDLQSLLQALELLVTALPFTPVILFDGLDRMSDMDRFASLITHDVPALASAGIGAVVVSPQRSRTWHDGSLSEHFDQLHLHGAMYLSEFLNRQEGMTFLHELLTLRAGDQDIFGARGWLLVRFSGGLPRDLLALARAAAEEAYRAGDDTVKTDHVRIAADRFGRDLLVGLDAATLEHLRKLAGEATIDWDLPHATVPFTAATENDIALLLRRLIIEVGTVPVSYTLHPTIISLIARRRRRA